MEKKVLNSDQLLNLFTQGSKPMITRLKQVWQESYYLKLGTSPAKLITSESSSTDLSDDKAAYGKLCENFWPVFGDMPEIVITKESFQIIDSIYSQMVAEIIVIIFYYFTFKDVLKCF